MSRRSNALTPDAPAYYGLIREAAGQGGDATDDVLADAAIAAEGLIDGSKSSRLSA